MLQHQVGDALQWSCFGFLLLVSMLLTAGLAAFTRHFGSFIPEPLMQAAGFVVSFAAISVLFVLMFKWLPDAEVDWRDVWLGGIGTAALFEIGKFSSTAAGAAVGAIHRNPRALVTPGLPRSVRSVALRRGLKSLA